jgi:hypothetical protein
VVCLDGVLISDAHALAVLPNIARFTLDEELSSAFVIITYESREKHQKVIQEDWMSETWVKVTDTDVGTRSGRRDSHRVGNLGAKRRFWRTSRYSTPMGSDLMESRPR